MKSIRSTNAAIYSISDSRKEQVFENDRARRSFLKQNEDLRRRIELLQGFEMPGQSTQVLPSPDGTAISLVGGWPPCTRTYEVAQLSMKHERRLTSECVRQVALADDLSKSALLLADRSIAFHEKYGHHHSLRVPTASRDMAYNRATADLYVASAAGSLFRIDLNAGRFSPPIADGGDAGEGLNRVAVSTSHAMVAAGGSSGVVRLYDARQKEEVAVCLAIGLLSLKFVCATGRATAEKKHPPIPPGFEPVRCAGAPRLTERRCRQSPLTTGTAGDLC